MVRQATGEEMNLDRNDEREVFFGDGLQTKKPEDELKMEGLRKKKSTPSIGIWHNGCTVAHTQKRCPFWRQIGELEDYVDELREALDECG